jgi:hypothetical protein
MRTRLVPAVLSLIALLGAAACTGDEPSGPELRATLQAGLTRTPAALTWNYTLRNDEPAPIAVFNGALPEPAGAPPMAWITGRDDDTVEVAQRILAPPDGVDPARDVTQYGTILAPGASLTGSVTAPNPPQLRHPYQGAGDLDPLPSTPERVVFCVGIARESEAGAQPGGGRPLFHHNEGTASHQHLVCTAAEPLAG